MRHLLALAFVASTALVMNACAAPTTAEDSASEAEQALQLTEETETSITGTFANGESVVSFSARLEAPFVRSALVVNGATYEYELDVVKSVLVIDGHSNTILGADAEVLQKLEKAFDRAGSPTKIREAMFRTIALMSAAPRGTTIMKREILPASAPKLDQEQDRGYCDVNDGTTYLCGCNAIPTGCAAAFVGYGGPEGSNPKYHAGGTTGTQYADNGSLGRSVTGCTTTPTYTHEHEGCESTGGATHGRVTWAARCGWSAAQCEGRCGAGCPTSYNFYITKDCLDHDVCLNNHPNAATTSTWGDCGNEFDRASGDFSSGTGKSFRDLCGSWMIGEDSR